MPKISKIEQQIIEKFHDEVAEAHNKYMRDMVEVKATPGKGLCLADLLKITSTSQLIFTSIQTVKSLARMENIRSEIPNQIRDRLLVDLLSEGIIDSVNLAMESMAGSEITSDVRKNITKQFAPDVRPTTEKPNVAFGTFINSINTRKH